MVLLGFIVFAGPAQALCESVKIPKRRYLIAWDGDNTSSSFDRAVEAFRLVVPLVGGIKHFLFMDKNKVFTPAISPIEVTTAAALVAQPNKQVYRLAATPANLAVVSEAISIWVS